MKRFDEIEVGDTISYVTTTLVHKKKRYVQDGIVDGQHTGHYEHYEEIETRARGFYISRRVTAREGDAWKLDGKESPLLTRENFWALRKAPGKGKSGENRFEADDAVVSCQVCAGSWIGNTGLTPHHGYTRPGWGEQTASCMGAKKIPYAVKADKKGRVSQIGRDVLPFVILQIERSIERVELRLAKVVAGNIDLPRIAVFNSMPGIPNRPPHKPGEPGYARRQEAIIRELERDLVTLRAEFEYYRARMAAWTPGGAGVMIAPVLSAPAGA